MTEADMILKQFHPNEPILVEDIIKMFPDHSRYWIDNTLKAMVASRQLSRFATGVYYIPKYDIFADNRISVDKVVNRKFIQNYDDVFGYVDKP